MKKIYFLLLLLCIQLSVYARQKELTATAPSVVKVGELFRVTYSLNDSVPKTARVTIKQYGKFHKEMGPAVSTSTSIQVMNGKKSSECTTSYTYMFSLKEEGTYYIPQFTLQLEGEEYKSATREILVISANEEETADSPDDVLIRVEFDRDTICDNEWVTAAIKVYTKHEPLAMNVSRPVSFDGFLIKELENTSMIERVAYEGKPYYRIVTGRYSLFPLYTGTILIQPGSYTVNTRNSEKETDIGPGKQVIPVKSDPASLFVKPSGKDILPFIVGDIPEAAIVFEDSFVEEEPEAILTEDKPEEKTVSVSKLILYFLFGLLILLILYYVLKLAAWRDEQMLREHDHQTADAGSTKFQHLPFGGGILLLVVCIGGLLYKMNKPEAKMPIEVDPDQSLIYVLDMSSSMTAEDFKPNRLEAVRKLVISDLQNYPDQLSGLIAFRKNGYELSPLTRRAARVISALEVFDQFDNETDGTAIGTGLALGVQTAIRQPYESRAIVLFTDGVNNSGCLSPKTATDLATLFNIRLYIVGIGADGDVEMPVRTSKGKMYISVFTDIDEELLTTLSRATGGEYFRVKNDKELRPIIHQIRTLHSTPQSKAFIPAKPKMTIDKAKSILDAVSVLNQQE